MLCAPLSAIASAASEMERARYGLLTAPVPEPLITVAAISVLLRSALHVRPSVCVSTSWLQNVRHRHRVRGVNGPGSLTVAVISLKRNGRLSFHSSYHRRRTFGRPCAADFMGPHLRCCPPAASGRRWPARYDRPTGTLRERLLICLAWVC